MENQRSDSLDYRNAGHWLHFQQLGRQRHGLVFGDQQSSFNHNERAYYGGGHFYLEFNSDTDANPNSDTDSNSDIDANPNSDTDSNTNANPDSDTDTDSYRNTNTNSYSYPYTDANNKTCGADKPHGCRNVI